MTEQISPSVFNLWLRRVVITVVGLLAVAAVTRGVNELRVPKPEIPPGAEETKWHAGGLGLGFYRQASFKWNEPYPSERALEFYSAWASKRGWEAVTPEEEPWSGFEWFGFGDSTTSPRTYVDNFFGHWVSPDRQWSLRLVLNYRRTANTDPRQTQNVYVLTEPFNIIGGPVDS